MSASQKSEAHPPECFDGALSPYSCSSSFMVVRDSANRFELLNGEQPATTSATAVPMRQE
jgi:hypothetical protein